MIFNGSNIRNRERFSILEEIEKQRIEEFKNKGKKTLRQFIDNRKPDQNIFPSFTTNGESNPAGINRAPLPLNSNISSGNILDLVQRFNLNLKNRGVVRKQNVSCLSNNATYDTNPLSINNSQSISNDPSSSPSIQKFTRDALIKLKESITNREGLARAPSSLQPIQAPPKYLATFAQVGLTPERKPSFAMGPNDSPMKDYERIPSMNSGTGSIQGVNLQMILNNTITKLKKKPNQRHLKPLDILKRFQEQLA